MKKGFVVGLALLIGIAFVTCAFAQTTTDKATKAATDAADKAKATGEAVKTKAAQTTEKAAPSSTAAAPEKKSEKQAIAKAKTKHARGEVTAIDGAAKSMIIKGKKGETTFDLSDAKIKKEPMVGDKVFVKYTEVDGKNMAKYVSTGKRHKTHKKAEKKEPTSATPAPTPAK